MAINNNSSSENRAKIVLKKYRIHQATEKHLQLESTQLSGKSQIYFEMTSNLSTSKLEYSYLITRAIQNSKKTSKFVEPSLEHVD
jgi:hypothetical protein